MKKCIVCGKSIHGNDRFELCKECGDRDRHKGYSSKSGDGDKDNKITEDLRENILDYRKNKIEHEKSFRQMLLDITGSEKLPPNNKICVSCCEVKDKLIKNAICKRCYDYMYRSKGSSKTIYNKELVLMARNSERRIRIKDRKDICEICGRTANTFAWLGKSVCRRCYKNISLEERKLIKSKVYKDIKSLRLDTKAIENVLKYVKDKAEYFKVKHYCKVCGDEKVFNYKSDEVCISCKRIMNNHNLNPKKSEDIKEAIELKTKLLSKSKAKCLNCGEEAYRKKLCRQCYLTARNLHNKYRFKTSPEELLEILENSGWKGVKPTISYPISDKVRNRLEYIEKVKAEHRVNSIDECVVCGGSTIDKTKKRGVICTRCAKQISLAKINIKNPLAYLEYFEYTGKLK